MTQYGFYMNTDRCIKCYACEVACKAWNGIKAGGVARRKVYEATSGTFPNVTRTFVSVSCMHCENAPCAQVCPSGAITKRTEDGIVVVDKSKCIGCHYCLAACPFGIPKYSDDGMEKCDCCIGNGVTPGDTPHCVATCPTQALTFGTIDKMSEGLASAAAAALIGKGSVEISNSAKAPNATEPTKTSSVGAPTIKVLGDATSEAEKPAGTPNLC